MCIRERDIDKHTFPHRQMVEEHDTRKKINRRKTVKTDEKGKIFLTYM